MLFIGCKLKPVDNSGVKLVRCIRIISKTKKFAIIGDLIGVVIKQFKITKKLLKKTMYYGLIVATKYPIQRLDGIKVIFGSNRVVLLNTNLKVLSTRLFGPIGREVRNNFVGKGRHRKWRYDKIVSLAKKVV